MVQNQTPTVGSIKRPGTYTQYGSTSGVVGQGGSTTGKVIKSSANNSSDSQQKSNQQISYKIPSSTSYGIPAQNPPTASSGFTSQISQPENKLASVLQPPVTALTPSLPKSTYPENKLEEVIKPRPNVFSSVLPKTSYQEGYSNVPKDETILDVGKNLLYGEAGKRLVGVGSSPGIIPGQPLITFQEVKSSLAENTAQNPWGFTSRVASEFVPTTPLELGITGGTAALFPLAPPAARIAASAAFSYMGTKEAFNPLITPEKRVASGILVGLGAFGAYSESTPYFSGTLARVSRNYKPVVEEVYIPKGKSFGVTFEKIKGIVGKEKTFDIALIEPGNMHTGNEPAFTSSAYGFSPKYQAAYIDKQTTVATSAQSLFKPLRTEIKINPGESGLGLFGTPADIQTGFPQTRKSFLQTKSFRDLFKFENPSYELKFTQTKPQIGVFENAKVTSEGGGGTFKAFGRINKGRPTTELEVTSLENVRKGEKLGVTKIGLTKVDIYSASLIPKSERINLKAFEKSNKEFFNPSYGKTRFVSPSGLASSSGSISKSFIAPSRNIKSDFVSSVPYTKSFDLGISRNTKTKSPNIASRDFGFSLPPSPIISPPPSPPPSRDFGFSLPPSPTISPPPSFPRSGRGSSFFTFPSRVPTGLADFGTPKRKRKAKRRKSRILPSFTAEVFDIRGSLPKGGGFGVSPFEIRAIPRGKRNPYATRF